MLIIPLTGKVSLRNPPAITIALILINCFVFFVLQAGDGKRYERAGQFYCESGLAEIELSEYLNYARDTGSDRHIDPGVKLEDMDEEAIINFSIKIQNDYVFLNKLLNDEIITPEDDIYEKWKGLRLKFGDMMSKIVSVKYGLKPAERNLLTAFTYMFIHGSFMHLLGNMIFLWFVGCALELGCGRLLYTGIYILTGIFAAWLFAMVYSYSRVPLVGASGAISGLMGAFTVLYGKKKDKGLLLYRCVFQLHQSGRHYPSSDLDRQRSFSIALRCLHSDCLYGSHRRSDEWRVTGLSESEIFGEGQ